MTSIRVECLSGKQCFVCPPAGTSVGALKDIIEQETQLLRNQQRLICGSIVLDDDFLLESLQQGSEPVSLQLVLISLDPVSELLERRGLSCVNAVDRDGCTALHLAAIEGDASLCAALLAHPEFKLCKQLDRYGWTALDIAREYGHSEDLISALMVAEHGEYLPQYSKPRVLP
eukprot:gnl/TRDRNA2_/TRDRNA2_39937_c0_seq1.p1 gnl/TRDRNA2_/TRDRNA2_39937_c0~~gnl/TRDRNA2_/TRDRNA2_39937_c0_seq1.p1  ORF type:complete len:173 (-),score=21.71 gnl/TRDRNA2_/TRDRNA2_39937_c0_seq1:59-577(-)